MPNPFFAILLLFCIFCVLLCLSVLLNILYHYKACNNQSNYNNNEKNQRKSKIYHFKLLQFTVCKGRGISRRLKFLFSHPRPGAP